MGAFMKRLALFLLLTSPACAHTRWADGSEVPAWVKSSCCGPADAHHLDPSDVTLEDDGYHIKGYEHVIPVGKALPSQDGDYWLFYSTTREGYGGNYQYLQSYPYCFFVPANI